MKILFLSDNFVPEVNAPASRTFEHCKDWASAGHSVVVVTCVPNFPAGRIFNGYRNWPWQKELIEGIKVIRVWSYITSNSGFVRRTLDYLSFMITGFLAGVFVRRPDIIIGTSPQFFVVCGAWLISAVKRKPFVFELRDLWPESIKAVGAIRDGLTLRFLESVELFLYKRARRIVSVTHSFKDALSARGVSPDKISVVTNGVDLSQFGERPKDRDLLGQLRLSEKFIVGYIGTHGMAHGLTTILEAAKVASERDELKNVFFLFVGDGAERQNLLEMAERMQLSNVLLLRTVPKCDIAKYWSILDVAVIHLKDHPLFRTVLPSKLFESMGMGIPVLLGLAGEAADIVLRERIGAVFRPGSAVDLVDQIQYYLSDPVALETCRKYALRAALKYDRSSLAAKMLRILSDVVVTDRENKQLRP
ncbi:MAG: glycosyltransferase family 4 protein [Steroidobacteraceae bacterium]